MAAEPALSRSVTSTDPYGLARQGTVLSEAPAPRARELEIQARLFHGEFGCEWTTLCGEKFRVVHFGEWNREAGPDFKNARIEFEARGTQEGDIEVDWEARDWENHGHAVNPSFADTRLHFFVHGGEPAAFARSSDNRHIPQARLSLENPPAPASRAPSGTVTAGDARAMIDLAARFRLRRKHESLLASSSLHGEDAALFFAIATGLGYKNNSIPFLLTAQRVGWMPLRGVDGEALLFGIAGFLEPRGFDDADEITKTYLKPLWDAWWKVRDNSARGVLPGSVWRFSGIRPSNHPHRRLGALATVASDFPRLRRLVRESGAKGFLRFFAGLEHPYWTHHWNLSAAPLQKPVALVGGDRALDLLVNAYIPLLEPALAEERLRALRGPQPGGVHCRASVWLTGLEEPELLRTAWDQQGLLQLYRDFGALAADEAFSKIRCAG